MFDLSFFEVAIVVVIALIIVKPEDIPGILKVIARGVRKIKSFSSEIMALIEDTGKETGLKDLSNEMTTIIDLDGNEQKAYDPKEIDKLADKKIRNHK